MSSKKVLVTGGAGFIGSYLCKHLIKLGYSVRILDSLSKQIHGSEPLKSDLYNEIKDITEFIHGDVRNISDIEKALDGVEYICHLAAETGTGQSMYQITNYSEVNVNGTANLLQAIVNKKTSVKKIILASSRSVYGEGEYHCTKCGTVTPKSRTAENMSNGKWSLACPYCKKIVNPIPTKESAKIDPNSIYAVTKYSQELLLKTFCDSYKIPFVIFRFQNVYGKGQSLSNPYTGVLAAFVTQLINSKSLEIFEDGTEARDFVHVSDIVDTMGKSVAVTNCDNYIINLGSGTFYTIYDAAKILLKHFKINETPKITGRFRVGDIYNCYSDNSIANKLIDYNPQVNFETGLIDFAEWAIKKNPSDIGLENSLIEMRKKGLYK